MAALPNILVFDIANAFFGHASFLVNIACVLRNIHTITFTNAFVMNESEWQTSDVQIWPSLHTIDAKDDDQSSTFIEWLSRLNPLPPIRRLSVPDIRTDSYGRRAAFKLLHSAASTLEELSVTGQCT